MTTPKPSITLRERFARFENAPFIAFLAPAALLFAFFKIAGEMKEGETEVVDRAVLAALRAPGNPHDPIGPAWLDAMVRDLTSLGSTSVIALLTLIAVGFLFVVRRRVMALEVMLAAGGGALISTVLKHVFERPRPAFIAAGVPIDTFSFPSGHAMLSAVIYLTLGALLTQVVPGRRSKAYVIGVAIALTMVIGLSRVYLGVHYPSDVLAGWIVGAAWAIFCREAARTLTARAPPEPVPVRAD